MPRFSSREKRVCLARKLEFKDDKKKRHQTKYRRVKNIFKKGFELAELTRCHVFLYVKDEYSNTQYWGTEDALQLFKPTMDALIMKKDKRVQNVEFVTPTKTPKHLRSAIPADSEAPDLNDLLSGILSSDISNQESLLSFTNGSSPPTSSQNTPILSKSTRKATPRTTPHGSTSAAKSSPRTAPHRSTSAAKSSPRTTPHRLTSAAKSSPRTTPHRSTSAAKSSPCTTPHRSTSAAKSSPRTTPRRLTSTPKSTPRTTSHRSTSTPKSTPRTTSHRSTSTPKSTLHTTPHCSTSAAKCTPRNTPHRTTSAKSTPCMTPQRSTSTPKSSPVASSRSNSDQSPSTTHDKSHPSTSTQALASTPKKQSDLALSSGLHDQKTTEKQRKKKKSDIYIVEAIQDERYTNGKVEYYVKWKTWPRKYNTWEPEENILDKRLITQYEQRKKGQE